MGGRTQHVLLREGRTQPCYSDGWYGCPDEGFVRGRSSPRDSKVSCEGALFRLRIHWSLPSLFWLHTARHMAMHTASVAHHTQRLALEDAVESRGPVMSGPLGETAAVEIPALNGIFASARSRQPTDSPPAAGLPDDSDSSRWLARALAPQVCETPLSRADVTQLDSDRLGDLPPLEDRGPLKSSGPPASQDALHAHSAQRKV
jgi:hypothetical protein